MYKEEASFYNFFTSPIQFKIFQIFFVILNSTLTNSNNFNFLPIMGEIGLLSS